MTTEKMKQVERQLHGMDAEQLKRLNDLMDVLQSTGSDSEKDAATMRCLLRLPKEDLPVFTEFFTMLQD